MTTRAVTNPDVREFLEGDENMIQKWANTGPAEWAKLGGVLMTGASRERDTGVTFGQEVAEVSTQALLDLRYDLIDKFAPHYDTRFEFEPHEEGTIESLVINLLKIVETEIGGRWVSSGSNRRSLLGATKPPSPSRVGGFSIVFNGRLRRCRGRRIVTNP